MPRQIWEPMSVLKRTSRRNCWIILLVVLFPISCLAQGQTDISSCNLLFYNVENLWDVVDDPKTQDEEFLPQGERHWTSSRLTTKLNHTAKVILASCGFDVPAIVGLCEIENRKVLEQLVTETPLDKLNYRIIHKDSPDDRGIDVALLYRPELVVPIEYAYLPLKDDAGNVLSTREILHVCFLFPQSDTLHVFVNHWPSRYGGQAETEVFRRIAAQTLKREVGKIMERSRRPKIVMMGDFNDQPQNESICRELGALQTDSGETGELINLSANWAPDGTLKHRQSWQIFDQLIVSDFLLMPDGLHARSEDARIVKLPFLFEPDSKFEGQRLFRTYLGFKYQGGFSDHLPVSLKLSYPN